MVDQDSRAHPDLEPASIRIGGQWQRCGRKHGTAHELSKQAD
jgi:hypothetical protein